MVLRFGGILELVIDKLEKLASLGISAERVEEKIIDLYSSGFYLKQVGKNLENLLCSAKLSPEMVEMHLFPSRRINRCSSCKEQVVYVANEFCRECPKCYRVFAWDDHFQQVNPDRSTAPPAPLAHLKNALWKWKIDKMFSSNEVVFLGNLIAQFQAKTGKSVNYSYSLHNYFQMVPSKCWPRKKEIMESISHRLPKSFAARRRAKQEFDEWRSTISVSNPTPTSVLN